MLTFSLASEQDPSHLMSQFPPREEGAKPVSYASLLEQACFEFRAACVFSLGRTWRVITDILGLILLSLFSYCRSVKQGTRRVFLVTDDDDPTSRELNPKAVVMGKKAMRTKLKVIQVSTCLICAHKPFTKHDMWLTSMTYRIFRIWASQLCPFSSIQRASTSIIRSIGT